VVVSEHWIESLDLEEYVSFFTFRLAPIVDKYSRLTVELGLKHVKYFNLGISTYILTVDVLEED